MDEKGQSRGGSRIPWWRGCQLFEAPTYDYTKTFKTMHEIENILVSVWGGGKGVHWDVPLDPSIHKYQEYRGTTKGTLSEPPIKPDAG